jgi:CelD/BcsL family acetyltransferase involved in cellulose biosynthesis
MREWTVVPAGAVRENTGSSTFESVLSAWSELGGTARYFFQTPEWIRCMSSHAGADVHLSAMRENGRPVATFVVERRARRFTGIDFTILLNVPFEPSESRLADGVIDRALGARITVEEVACVFGRWDVLNLSQLRLGSPWLELANCTKYVRTEAGPGSAVIDTSMAFEERWARMPRKLRASIRAARRRIEARGGAQVSVANAHAAAAFDEHVALEAAGYKGVRRMALAQTSSMRDLWRDYLLASDTAQIRTLHINGGLAASLVGSLTAGAFVAINMAYDQNLAELSPGSVLWADLIESCCADPTVQRIDCLGYPRWAYRWAMEREPTYSLLAFNDGLRGAVAKMGWPIRQRIKALR